jgi:hypothetical protein
MIDSGSRSAVERAIALAACAAVVVAFLSIETRLANQPYDGPHEDNAATFMGSARNHLRYGFSRTLGQDLQEPGTGWYGDLGSERRYLHHPPGLSLTLAASMAVFGDTRATGRLTAVFFHLFSLLAVLTGAYRFMGGAWAAALAGALFTLTPLSAFFGRSVDYQTFTLPFFLWSQILFVEHRRRSDGHGFRNLAILVACVGGLFDWDVYFWILTAAICEGIWPRPGCSRWRAALPWAAAGASTFAAVVTHIVLIAGSGNELMSVLLKWVDGNEKVSSAPVDAHRLFAWFGTVFSWQWQTTLVRMSHGDFTGPLLLAAVASTLYGVIRLARGDGPTDGQRLVALSAIPGILYLLAIPAALGHQYGLMPVAGAVSWAGADAVIQIPGAKRTAGGAVLLLCVLWTAGPWVDMYFGACFAPYRLFGTCERSISFRGFGKITYRTPARASQQPR